MKLTILITLAILQLIAGVGSLSYMVYADFNDSFAVTVDDDGYSCRRIK